MIIYGSGSTHLNSVQSKHSTCPNCGTKGSLVFSVYRRHAHIFWIPLFPIGKFGASQCQNCQNVMEKSQMPEDIKTEYKAFKETTSGPIWQFSGLAIIAALVVFITFSSNEAKKKEATYLAAPKSGDVYEYKIQSGSYSTMKVLRVEGDTIRVVHNDYETNKISGINDIDIDAYYTTDTFGIALSTLKELHESGEIIDINRN